MFAEYLAMKDAGELRGPEVEWTPDEDRVLLTERVSLRDRQDELYVLDTDELVDGLDVVVPVLDGLGRVKRSDDPTVVLPAVVIAGAKRTDPRELIYVARDRLDLILGG